MARDQYGVKSDNCSKGSCDDVEYSLLLKDENKKILGKFFSSHALIYDPLKAGSIDGTDTVAHDRAVSKALNATYHPPPTTNNPENTIIVARLNRKTTEQKLFKAFSEFGKIRSCKLVRCIVTGESKRYAFVEYEERGGAMAVFRRGHKMRLDDAQLLVDFECEHLLPHWIPRRLGGGFGGKKESGQLRFGCKDRPFRKPIPMMTMSTHKDETSNF